MADNRRLTMGKLVLVVDDQPSILSTLSAILADEGYRAITTESGEEALRLYEETRPDVVFLDIWLADMDGLETLQALRQRDPRAAVIMISGHGTAATAVQALKMGASDFIEKPLSYGQVVAAVAGALQRKENGAAAPLQVLGDDPIPPPELTPPPELPLLRTGTLPQRTLRASTVLYGLGLHSGARTGMALQPLPPDSGLHIVTLPTRTHVPVHVDSVGDTDYATTLQVDGQAIKTVEHLLSALHARGVTNLLIKVHGEIPVLDGSALEFCQALEQVGVVDQEVPRRELVVDRRYEVSGGNGKLLSIEPFDGFAVSYLLRYPPPIGEQRGEFTLTSFEAYEREIAPARTFGFMKDLKMMSELGLGTGGRLDNCILVGDEGVVNTTLRFPDEFVRHKILDIIGDLYLLGYPIRGRVTARLTGHRDNIALLRAIQAANPVEVPAAPE
ncbi:MAG TPA: UDP-3-O-acyl-N-acetylglucosamine deacetylase [Thermoanaerobaculia bacterium]|nr:UDP-3-O-acyl-N-acetylglucosamine deacetylase [Thermoanaerobaculia bacterium]